MSDSSGSAIRSLRFSCACALAVVISAASANAQGPRPERPYRGLFGSGASAGDFEQQVSVNASVGTGYDDNLLADALDVTTPTFSDLDTTHGGTVSTGSASLGYLMNRGRVMADANGGTSLRYYPSLNYPGLNTNFVRQDYASGALNVNVGKGFSASTGASYQPFSSVSMFPAVPDSRTGLVVFDEDLTYSSQHYASYSAGLRFNHDYSRRTTLNFDTGYVLTDSTVQESAYSYEHVGGNVTHHLTRDVGLRLGYQFQRSDYGSLARSGINHVLDVGVDYQHALSKSRRTNVAFSTGASAVASGLGEDPHWYAIGSASLTHEIGRSWFTSLSYERGVQYIEGWQGAVFSDTATVNLSGFVTTRVQLQASVRAATGSDAFNDNGSNTFTTYYANAGASFGINRHMNAGITYAYYNHKYSDLILLPPGFPPYVSRASLRVYVSFWAPVFQRARRQ